MPIRSMEMAQLLIMAPLASLRRDVRACVTEESWKQLENEVAKADGAWGGQYCLARIRGYCEFARHHGLLTTKGKKLGLSLRAERDAYYPGQVFCSPPADKAYLLLLPEQTVTGAVGAAGGRFAFAVDDAPGAGTFSLWATGRFLDPSVGARWTGPPATRPLFGFCGQLPGLSKQVLGGALPPRRAAALRACSPDDPLEYPFLAEGAAPGASVVTLDLTVPALLNLLQPRAVLDAAVRFPQGGAADGGDVWHTLPGFGEGTLPGLTSRGRHLLLIQSAQVSSPQKISGVPLHSGTPELLHSV